MKGWNECTLAQKIERWENVIRVLQSLTPHERKRHFEMAIFGEKTDCGTRACAAGFCSLDPWFRRRGFKFKFTRLGDMVVDSDDPDEEMGDFTVNFFGEDGSEAIFFNGNTEKASRPVSQVIKEVKAYIKELKGLVKTTT